jgi:hypothetical protein
VDQPEVVPERVAHVPDADASEASTITSRDWKQVRNTKTQPHEKVTYRFRMHYFSGIQEWNLVLTPPQPTDRDGAFTTVWEFKDSYLLKATYVPEWKWP